MHVDLRSSEAISVAPPHMCMHMDAHSDTFASHEHTLRHMCTHVYPLAFTIIYTQTQVYTHVHSHEYTLRHMHIHVPTCIHVNTQTHENNAYTYTPPLKNLILKTGKCIHINLGPKGLAIEKIEAPSFVRSRCLSRDLQLRHRPLWEAYPCFSPTRVDLFTFLQVQTSASITRSPGSALLGVKVEPARAPHEVCSAQSTSAPEA